MSLISSLSDNSQHKEAMYTPKKPLQYEFDDDKTHLLSLLHQLNIETDSIECDNQNSKSSYNNSYVPIETKDNLSALYAHYQIDPQLYPPPDLQLNKIIQSSSHPSHSYLQPSRLKTSSLSEQQRKNSNNSTRRSRSWRKKQNRLRSNRNRKKNNHKRTETNKFHYHNTITVRRISCHNMLHSQIMMKKQFKFKQNNLKDKKIKNECEWENNKTRSANLIENKSQKYKKFPTEFKSSSIQSTMSKSLCSPSIPKTLTTPISNSLFQQQELRKEMSNSMRVSGLKVTSLRDSSTSSLMSTQLHAVAYNQTKPNVVITTTNSPDSQIGFGSIAVNSPNLSTTTSSTVPHIPHHILPSTITMPNVSKIETAVVAPTSINENIQDLVDQLKTCIATLSLLLQNKTEDEKPIISNVKSYSDKKRSRTKKKQSQSSSSLTSTSNHVIFSKKPISNEKNLVFEDITVRRCNSFNNQRRKKYHSDIPSSCINQHDELKRCLLICCHDRANKNRGRNINSNERQRHSHCTWYDLASNEHVLLSQSSQLIPNNSIDIISASKSTLILSEKDDEYELLNKFSRVSSLLK